MLSPRAAVAFLLAVFLTLVASCATEPATEFSYMRVTVGGESVLGISKKDIQIRGLVVFFQAPDKDEFVLTGDGAHTSLTQALTNAGFAVIASNARENIFLKPGAVQSYAEIAGRATAQFKTHNIYFLAESLGALAAVTLLSAIQTDQVRGMAAINPALNLDTAPSEFRAEFEASRPDMPIDSINPLNLPPDSFDGKKLRFYVSPTDDFVPTEANALAFQERFGSVANISIAQCTGGHLDPTCISGEDIVKWFTELEYRAEP